MGIDNRTRALVYYLSKIEGLSFRQIAKKCNVPRATVWRISKMDLSSKQPSTMANGQFYDRKTHGERVYFYRRHFGEHNFTFPKTRGLLLSTSSEEGTFEKD